MTQANLKDKLRSMVTEYGIECVHESLREIESEESHTVRSSQNAKTRSRRHVTEASNRSPRITALEYVGKMALSPKKMPSVVELAARFEEKSFLPSFRDIANFCQIYGIDEPASKSRSSALPRLFKFIASMETDDINRIIYEGQFSGPSRLGPIADAIRRNGRAGIPVDSYGTTKDA